MPGAADASVGVSVLLGAAVAAATVLVVALAAADVVVAAARAQDAADVAALAAARALGDGGDPTDAARRAATAAGATLVRCDCHRAPVSVVVRTPVTATAARGLGVSQRTATASARLVPP